MLSLAERISALFVRHIKRPGRYCDGGNLYLQVHLSTSKKSPGSVNKSWFVPAERMKSKREHRVPLSDAAVAAIGGVRRRSEHYVFLGHKRGSHLSSIAMLQVLKRLGRKDITVHGFRSTFRDWCAECTNYPSDVAEMALAHVLRDKTEAAYRRGDLLEKRARLMLEWARYCSKPAKPAKVIAIRQGTV